MFYDYSMTSKEEESLLFLHRFHQENGFMPTFEQIVDSTGYKTKSAVSACLDRLEDDGWIARTKYASRAIKLIKSLPGQDDAIENVRFPSRLIPILGIIEAGRPINIPDPNYSQSLVAEKFKIDLSGYSPKYHSRDLFALKVKGSSMIDSHVLDGDIIILEPTPVVEDG